MEDDGTNVRQLTFDGAYNASPSWSPLGSMIAFVSRFEGKFDLFIFKLTDGKSYQITTGVSSNESPSWSPDGRSLVFIGSRSSGGAIYRSDLSGASVLPISNLGLCQSPVWSIKN
jgi:TolB protein